MSESQKSLLLVHGASQYSRPNLLEKWVPVLNAAFGSDWNIFLPEMPNPEAPRVDAWLKAVAVALENLDGRIYFVGHSLGGSVLLQYVARNMPGQKHLFIAAAPFWCGEDSNWQHEPFKMTDMDIYSLRSCQLTFYHGTEDDIVPYGHLAEYQTVFPDAIVRSYEGMNHIDPSIDFLRDLASDVVAQAERDDKSPSTDAEDGGG